MSCAPERTGSPRPQTKAGVRVHTEIGGLVTLSDPGTGRVYHINQVGLFIWQRLDGQHDVIDVVQELSEALEDVPLTAPCHVQQFVRMLTLKGLVT